MPRNYDPYFSFFKRYLTDTQEISDPVIRCEIYEGMAEYVFSEGTWPEFKHEAAAAVCKSRQKALDASISYSRRGHKAGNASAQARAAASGDGVTTGNMGEQGATEERSKEERSKEDGSLKYEGNSPSLIDKPKDVQEVKTAIEDMGLTDVDAFEYVDHYEKHGWQKNGRPFDWRANLKEWDSRKKRWRQEDQLPPQESKTADVSEFEDLRDPDSDKGDG